MGVKNLWRLLLPCGRRLSIDTLAHQTLAIDASIWLTQISKACRDPETGRLLPNKPHVRVFLLRLMRLLYHQIRPVVVFDGVMPEVKRREIQRRRDRRERLWRDDDAGDGSSGVLKRAAKKILVKQLKELREKERAAALGVKRKRDEDNQNGDENDGKDGTNRSQNGGAFAPGFTLPDDDDDDGDANENADDDGLQMQQSSPAIAEVNCEDDDNNIKNDDDDSVKEIQQYESDNDWEMSHAVQSSISDSIQQQRPGQHNNEATSNDNTAQHQSPSDDNNPFDHEHYASATDAYIASLPVETRSRWIDSQYAARRIESRRECIQAAANPDEYSSTQLRNFLKGSKLNKRVCEIGKMSKEFEERGSASDSGPAGESTVDREVGARARPALQRLRRYKDDAPGSDEDDGMFDSSGHPSNNRASMRVLFGEDDSDNSDDEGGGGFLVASPAKASSADEKEGSVVELLDDDCSDDSCNIQRDNGNEVPTEEDAAPSKCEHSNCRDTHLKPPPYQINNRKRSNAPNSAAFQRSKLMELSTAGQEWEQFGTSDNNKNGEELDTLIAQPVDKFTHLAKSNGVGIMDTLHTSDSDNSDNGHADSLLMLGNRYPPNQRSVGGAEPFHGIKSAGSCDDDEEDDVDWEDGDSGGCSDHAIEDDEIQNANGDARAMNDACEPFHSKEQKADPALTVIGENCDDANGLGFEQKNSNEPSIFHISNNHPWEETEKDLDDHDSSAVHHSKNENVLEVDDSSASNDEKSSKGVDNEFGSFHPDRRTSDALQHAQETASKLTSWAGRAFQRAMSQHVGEQSQTIRSPGGNETRGEIIDLDSSIVEQDAKMGVIDRQHKMSDADGHSSSFPKQQQKQQCSGIELDSFDTSLDGLNKVHNSIMEEEKAMERDMGTITEEMKEDILSLLRLCGIPWIESPSEAEAQCACLEELGLVDGIVTEDSDIFVFGGKKVYKNFFDEKKFVEAYFAKEIERKLALKKYQLVALAMLLGGDYTDGVKGVGIVNGMEVLQAFPIEDSADGIQVGLQQFREWLDGFDDPYRNNDSKKAVFHKKHSSARIRWIAPSDFPSQPIMNSYLNPVVDKSKAKFSWGRPDIAGLHVFCAETLGWEKEETDRVVNPVLEVISSGSTQRRLDSYFLMKYEDDIKFATVKSKRLKAVLEDIHRDNADDNVAVEDG